MKPQIRVIKTKQDYELAIAHLSSLMDEEFSPGSDKEAELELLALVIESYEHKIIPPSHSDPIDALLFRMEQQNLSKKDLVPYIGSLSRISEILSRKRPLSLTMIRNLHKGLGIPAKVLIADSGKNIDLSSEPPDYTKYPLQEMFNRGCFPNFKSDPKQLKDYAEDLISEFVKDIHIEQPALLSARLYQSGSRIMNEYALFVWHVCVLKKARKIKAPSMYKEGVITDAWLRDLAKLSTFEKGPLLAQEFLANHGIKFIIEPHFKKTYLDGAAMLDGATPIVALTLRHDRLDNFWFALMHELIHVQKHLRASRLFIADNLDDNTRSSKEEQEADQGARDALIPANEWKKAAAQAGYSLEGAIALANKLRINPAIVAGRVRYETKNWKLLAKLISSKDGVRRYFEGQVAINEYTNA